MLQVLCDRLTGVIALKGNRFAVQKESANASPKLAGFFLCVAGNIFERQASDNLSSIWITGVLSRMDGENPISKVR